MTHRGGLQHKPMILRCRAVHLGGLTRRFHLGNSPRSPLAAVAGIGTRRFDPCGEGQTPGSRLSQVLEAFQAMSGLTSSSSNYRIGRVSHIISRQIGLERT
jgi:hypothetical protein